MVFLKIKQLFGLSIRASGENPTAASSRGINVKRMRLYGTLIGGALLGLAGASFSLYTKYVGGQKDILLTMVGSY